MKKTIAIILSLVLVLSLIPMTASAENTESYRSVSYQTRIQPGTPATTTMTFLNLEVLTDYGYGSAAGFTAELKGGKTYTISFVATTQYDAPHNVNLVVMPNVLQGSGVTFLGDNLTQSVDVENLGKIAGTAVKFTAPNDGDYKILITEGSLLVDDYTMVPVTCTVAVNEYVERSYSVSTLEQLSAIRDDINSFRLFSCEMNVKLTADIDAGNVQWTNPNNFCGTFDGNGKTISNIKLGNSNAYNTSLLGKVMASADVKNLTVNNVTVKGLLRGGAIAGMLRDSTVTGCHSSGVINCGTDAGGLIGTAVNSTVKDCSTSCAVGAGVGASGGFIGSATVDCSFENCQATGNVSGTLTAGGFIGSASGKTTITKCSAGGSVKGSDNIGGFIGLSSTSTITQCTASGNVEGSLLANDVGGFIGCASSVDTITRCSCTGSVSGSTAVGGFMGEAIATVYLNECKADGASVEGNTSLGGFVGKIGGGITILNSYAKGAVSTRTELRTNTNVGCFVGTISSGRNTIGNSYTISTLNVYADKVGLFAGSMEYLGACNFIGCYTAGNADVDNCTTSGVFVGKFAGNNNTDSSYQSCCYNSDAEIIVNNSAPIWSTNFVRATPFSQEQEVKEMEDLLNKCADEHEGYNKWSGRNSANGPELTFTVDEAGGESIDSVIDWVKGQNILFQIPLWIFYVPFKYISIAIKSIF